MNRKWYLIILVALWTHAASADNYPECNTHKLAPITFSGKEIADSLSVTVTGKPCYKAFLNIQIKSNDGKFLYQYKAPLKKHLNVKWDDPSLDKAAIDFVMRLIRPDSFGLTSELPAWNSEKEYYEETYQVLKVTREYYEELLSKKWITYYHPIHSEGWKIIVFDVDKNETVEVSSGGL